MNASKFLSKVWNHGTSRLARFDFERYRGNPTFRDFMCVVRFVLIRGDEIFELDSGLYFLG